ncbi:PEP-CTERM sorting domain-containing protein [Candidatus Omnitrophota bacterium]
MKKLLVLALAILIIGVSQNAYALLSNPGFESGDFTGWTATVPSGGSAAVVTAHTGFYSTVYGPVSGSYFAELKTDGPGSYTTLAQAIAVAAGEVIDGWAAFDARDYIDDHAMVRILASTGTPIATPWYASVSGMGSYVDGPWTRWTWTASTAGTYTVEYSVTNYGESDLDSYALFDAGPNVIPEPASLSLLGIGLLGLISRRRKKNI